MSSAQKHRIARQTIALDGVREQDAAALQAALSARFQADWLPVLEQVLSRLGDPQRVLRIDRLEVDLGQVTPDALLAAAADTAPDAAPNMASHTASGTAAPLLLRLEALLEERLRAALGEAAAVSTDQELLAFFLHSGALPWWADASDSRVVAGAIDALADAAPALWHGLLAGAGEQPSPDALRRLVAEAGPQRLAGLLARWRQAAGADDWQVALLPAWTAVLARAAAALAQSAPAWCDAWWQAALGEALQLAVVGGRAHAAGWWPGTLTRWLQAAAADAGLARQVLRRALDQPEAGVDWPAALWQALAGRVEGVALAAGGEAAAQTGLAERLGHALHALASTGDAATGWRTLHQAWPGLWARLPATLRQRVADAAGQAAALPAALAAVLAHAWPVVPAGAPAAPAATVLAELARQWAARLDRPVASAALAAPGPGPQAEALYVANAGLVLLWPFISHFAGRMDLLAGGLPARFRDQAAAARAALLLQRAIAGAADADGHVPEHQLPLNKLLCGLPLASPLPPMDPLGEAEHDEAEALLRAAIAQAPILRNQSSAGFRGSFGLREGQLSTRDGHWLLRVERQAWDLVLDRLPWGFGIVRLPWMPRLLQVQW